VLWSIFGSVFACFGCVSVEVIALISYSNQFTF